MPVDDIMALMANLDAQGRLGELDDVSCRPRGTSGWLFGLVTGLYFAEAETRPKRAAALRLAERYYDQAHGRINVIAYGDKVGRLPARGDIARKLEGQRAFARGETTSFYLRHMPKEAERHGHPVHEYLACMLPSGNAPTGHGRMMYQTRLAQLMRDPEGVVEEFVTACRELGVFYGVSGVSLQVLSYSTSAVETAYPLFQRFPGLLYEDGTGFMLEVLRRTDVIRDVNWLTAIDCTLLERVGGIEAARQALSDDVLLHSHENGVVFQAGPLPQLGDLENGRVPAAYKEVSDFLRSLRYGGWGYPYLKTPYGVDGMEATQRWSTRFD